ncbi:unnamed protein product [Caenorhabditis brenneri]
MMPFDVVQRLLKCLPIMFFFIKKTRSLHIEKWSYNSANSNKESITAVSQAGTLNLAHSEDIMTLIKMFGLSVLQTVAPPDIHLLLLSSMMYSKTYLDHQLRRFLDYNATCRRYTVGIEVTGFGRGVYVCNRFEDVAASVGRVS